MIERGYFIPFKAYSGLDDHEKCSLKHILTPVFIRVVNIFSKWLQKSESAA